MTAAEWERSLCASEVDVGRCCFGLVAEFILEGVNLVGSKVFELVEELTHFAFLFGRNGAEVVEQRCDQSLLAEVFYAQLFDFFG